MILGLTLMAASFLFVGWMCVNLIMYPQSGEDKFLGWACAASLLFALYLLVQVVSL